MIKFIDDFLNKITMYRLVMYSLIFMILGSVALSFFEVLHYDPIKLIIGGVFITIICIITNEIFAYIFEAPANVESVYITALILVLLITPIENFADTPYLFFIFWASVLSIASKYILAIRKKHIFNPAAFAVAITAISINQTASWWVGTMSMAPFVIIAGILIVRKIRRLDLVLSFIIFALFSIVGLKALNGADIITTTWRTLFYSPLLFFAFVMLTEPLTTPPTRWLRVAYGAVCGFLFSPSMHVGSIYSTPELSLLAGNIFSYFVSPKEKLILKLKEKTKVAEDTYDFSFTSDRHLYFKPGQYLEWTFGHYNPDTRGNRRYFTISSSPTEPEIHMGIKFYPQPSSFKKNLLNITPGDTIVASQLAGDFTIPKDPTKKLVFIAGGIGVTPFRSMIKFLIDAKQKRDIVLIYSNKKSTDIAYKDIFDQAELELGIKTVYSFTDKDATPPPYPAYMGFIDGKIIAKAMPDYLERYFYLSGPHGMVTAFEETLLSIGVKSSHIKTDFFPGFA